MIGTRRGRGGFGLFLLLAQIMRFGFDRVPPVTLATLGLNVAVFMGFLFPLKSVHSVCISVESVWYYKDWTRLFMGPIFHAGEWHLYYNMVSMLWKGSELERRYGSHYFGYMLVVFTALVHSLLIALNIACYEMFGDPFYIKSCAIGFSGVLFALKVIVTYHTPPGTQYLMGIIPVPSRWIYWAELGMIQLLFPNASLLGHLAGILVGLAFIKGPLKPIMDLFAAFVPGQNGGTSYNYGPSYTYHADSTGFRESDDTAGYRGPQTRTSYRQYTAGMSEDEQMQWAMNNSAQTETRPRPSAPADYSDDSPAPPGGAPYPETPTMPQPHQPTNRLYPQLPPDIDDLRQRRLERFN